MSSPVSAHVPALVQTPTSAPFSEYDEQQRTKRTHSKVAFSDNYDNETLDRPRTAGIVDRDNGQRFEHPSYVGRMHNDIEAAELLLSLGSGGKMLLPPTKRSRRDSTM
jgi:hypothetical protein